MSKEAKKRAAKERRAKRKQPKKKHNTAAHTTPKTRWITSIDVQNGENVNRVSLTDDAIDLIEKYELTGNMIAELAALHGGYHVVEDDDIGRRFVEIGLMTEEPKGWFHRTPMWNEFCSKMFKIESMSVEEAKRSRP